MYRLLGIGKTGFNAIQNKVDAIADELSNSNTFGYKRKEIGFQELLTNEVHGNDVILSNNVNHGRINVGTKSGISTINFQQGTTVPSTGEFHMAIEGSGFFGVYNREGDLILTRNGGFHINEDNSISDDNGNILSLDLDIPFDNWGSGEISISREGEVSQSIGDENIILGRVILYSPQVLDSLIPLGEGGYMPSPNVPLYNSLDNEVGFGSIIQFALEASNVEISKSMTDLIAAQRSYSFNAKALQSTDEIMSIVNNIKR